MAMRHQKQQNKDAGLAGLYTALKQDKIKPVYVFYGDEEFQISQAISAVQNKILRGIPRDFNFNTYHGKDDSIDKILESANTLPMMATRRLVILKAANEIREGALARLARYVDKPSPSTVLVISGSGLGNKRKLMASARKNGEVLQFKHLYARQLRPWIRAEVQQLDKTIGENGIDFLIDMVGENLRELHSEILKVSTFVGPAPNIRLEDLQAVISDVGIDTVFEFNNAIGLKQTGVALQRLARMLELDPRASANSVLAMLQRHFRQLYRTRILLDRAVPPSDIARQIGIPPNMTWKFQKELLPQANRRSRAELARGLKLLYQVNTHLRKSRVPEHFQLDRLVLDLCS